MKMFNIKTQYVLARMSSGRPTKENNFEANIKNAIKNIDETKSAVILDIQLLTKQLKIELSDSVKKDSR